MIDRREQLRALYGLDFPDELFAFWDWHGTLTGEAARAFREVLGISLHGPFDALAGKLDGRELRYPAVLHWRYQYDPPELFTVMVGDTDGLHWGYWFDDPGRLPPVVASFYARDSVDLTEHASLAHALEAHVESTRRGIHENRRADRAHAAEYARDLAALDALDATRPRPRAQPERTPAADTPEGMGIVVTSGQLATWRRPDPIDRDAILAFVDTEIAAGRPGTALLVGRALWDGRKTLALDVLVRAYAALDREPLRAVAIAHRAHPAIPSLDITQFRVGDYTDLADALAHPGDVRTLTIRHGAPIDGDYSSLVELRELDLAANRVTALPTSLAHCMKLEVVHLFNNELEALPPALVGLPALRELQLGRNRLTTLDGVERCRALVELDITDNRVARLPDAIGELVSLRRLCLAGNPLAELPASVGTLESLEELLLSGCPIARLPYDLSRLTHLRRVHVANTLLPAEEHARLRAAVPAVEIVGAPAPAAAAAAKSYSMKLTYAVGDVIAHPTFGAGVVRAVLADGRIDVTFHAGAKTLAHGRR